MDSKKGTPLITQGNEATMPRSLILAPLMLRIHPLMKIMMTRVKELGEEGIQEVTLEIA